MTNKEDSTQKEEFIKAVKNNDFAELEVNNWLTLVTDQEEDGALHPYALAYKNYSIEKINNVLTEEVQFLKFSNVYLDSKEYGTRAATTVVIEHPEFIEK